MSNKPVVFCRNCKHSRSDPSATWNLRCHNLDVNRKDSWALAASSDVGRGTDCHTERGNTKWFAVCGMKGKKYEALR